MADTARMRDFAREPKSCFTRLTARRTALQRDGKSKAWKSNAPPIHKHYYSYTGITAGQTIVSIVILLSII